MVPFSAIAAAVLQLRILEQQVSVMLWVIFNPWQAMYRKCMSILPLLHYGDTTKTFAWDMQPISSILAKS